jgi:hypothetical protein
VPIEDRETSLQKISENLDNIAKQIERFVSGTDVLRKIDKDKRIMTLFAKTPDAIVKIEPNSVIRGTVFPCEVRKISSQIQSIFRNGLHLEATTLSFADLYGGKICAALDRQHPRDLFDIKLLLEKEGISQQIRKAFLVYLISHDRPIHELLEPKLKDIKGIFETGFKGMTSLNIGVQELIEARADLITILKKSITYEEKEFLLSVKEGNPIWSLLGVNGVDTLPAVQWKLLNIKRMDGHKHKIALERLRKILLPNDDN